MKYRQLGSSDLNVSEISLGSWLTYGVGVELDGARACLDRAFDLGINFIDTANVYGRGAAETVLGELLAGRPRDSYVLATKVFFPMSDTDKGLSAAQIAKQIDASLKRLRTDCVDLYQCHRYDTETPLEETMEALSTVVRSARPATSASPSGRRIRSPPLWPCPASRSSSPASRSIPCSDRRPEQKVIPLCAANGISQIVWSPLAQGVLTGKYQPGAKPPADSRAVSESMGTMMQTWLPAGHPGGGAHAEAAGRGGRLLADPVLAGLGAARAQRRLGHRRRQPPRRNSTRTPRPRA